MTRGTSRSRLWIGTILAAGLLFALLAPALAPASIYRGKVVRDVFQPPRPKTDVVIQRKGKRARYKRLVLAFDCDFKSDKDPRILVTVSTPFTRAHRVLGNTSFDWNLLLKARVKGHRIRFGSTISMTPKKVTTSTISAVAGRGTNQECRDQYIHVNARRR
jgi:hypothetical protein